MTESNTESTPKKALSRQDQRNLEKLIEGDFQDAQNSILGAAEAHVRAATKQLEADYAELEALTPSVREEVEAFETMISDMWREKAASLVERGFEIIDQYGNLRSSDMMRITLTKKIQPKGKQEALRQIQDDAWFAQGEARRVLETARTRALRGVYIAGISGQAGLDLLESIPSAADAFAAALPKAEPKEIPSA